MKPKFTIGCFAVIFDEDNKVLLVHRRDRDLWVLPGGAMETGESPDDAVVREVNEETGLRVRVENLAGLYSKPLEDDILLLFTCKRLDGELTLNNEADKIEYFTIDNIPANTNPRHRGRIQDVLSSGDGIIFKIQK
ncbi:MAG: NUDIX domain-containing protein [Candidatus Saccharibacteria bacterium]|nr:NUDIX domain-containing protein [Candidatus Saccharibacteria bacterium]